jgi:hypothetical protein
MGKRLPWRRMVKKKLPETAICLKSPASEEYVFEKVAKILRATKKSKLDRLYAEQWGRCAHCSLYMWLIRNKRAPIIVKGQPYVATIEHLIPRSQGGTNAYENTVAACYGCNQKRGDRRLTAAELREIQSIRGRLAA